MKRSIIMLKHHSENSIKQPKFGKRKKRCLLKLLDHNLVASILNYLRLGEIVQFYSCLEKIEKHKETKRSIINYLILSTRLYSKWEQQEFVEMLIHKGREDHRKVYQNDRNRFSSSGETGNSFSLKMSSSVNEKSRINRCQENIKYDVQRTYIKIECNRSKTTVIDQKEVRSSKKLIKSNNFSMENMQDYLNRVLLNVSKKYPQVGYIQGLNYIVKTMFLTGLSEEHAYDYLCFFLEKKKFARILVNGMIGLRELAYALKVYTYNYVPAVYTHFEKHDVDTEIFATSWFITLFSEDLPLFITNKLWHLFALEGWKTLIQFSIAVLCAFQNEILSQNGDEIFSFLRKIMINFQEATPNRTTPLELTVWKLMSSIEVNNKIIEQLCQQMEVMQSDCEIELWKVESIGKKWKKTRAMSERALLLEQRSMSPHLTARVCCDRLSTSPSLFPFCQNLGSQCQ